MKMKGEKPEVKITYSPYKEIVIFELRGYPLQDLIRVHGEQALKGLPVPPLLWAEGVVFWRQGIPPTESTLKEMREKGRIYWMDVRYALMPKYSREIASEDGRIRISVVDVSASPPLRAAAKWIKAYAMSRA